MYLPYISLISARWRSKCISPLSPLYLPHHICAGGAADGARPLRAAAPLRRLLHTHRPGTALLEPPTPTPTPYPYPVPLPLPVQIPEWLSWVQYLCGLKYGMNLFILNEFGEATTEVWGRGRRRRRLRLRRRLGPNPYRSLKPEPEHRTGARKPNSQPRPSSITTTSSQTDGGSTSSYCSCSSDPSPNPKPNPKPNPNPNPSPSPKPNPDQVGLPAHPARTHLRLPPPRHPRARQARRGLLLTSAFDLRPRRGSRAAAASCHAQERRASRTCSH